MLRITWDKLNNPYLHFVSLVFRPSVRIHKQFTLKRPESSMYSRPVTCWIFFAGTEAELAQATELVLDFPGGGFVAMGPTHHEDRLRQWAKSMKRPIVSVDYGKAPECEQASNFGAYIGVLTFLFLSRSVSICH